jgi:hypothetical protein
MAQKLLLTLAHGGHWQANRSSNENHSLLELVNAAQLAALGAFPQPRLASTGERGYRRNHPKYQFTMDSRRVFDVLRPSGDRLLAVCGTGA